MGAESKQASPLALMIFSIRLAYLASLHLSYEPRLTSTLPEMHPVCLQVSTQLICIFRSNGNAGRALALLPLAIIHIHIRC